MDIRKVKKLVELVESSDVSKIKISDKEGKISITCGSSGGTQVSPSVATTLIHQTPPPTETKEEVTELNGTSDFSGTIIRSPMVGVFYAASSPGQAPFVEIGTAISVGQTLCIIEAMKVMNQITVEQAGKIVKIFVKNAQPVEYNQPLFGIV